MRTSITKEVCVDIDIDDVLEDLTAEQLAELGVVETIRDELPATKLAEYGLYSTMPGEFVPLADLWQNVRFALLRGDLDGAHALIQQIADEQAGVLLVFDRTPLRRVA
jgi:hypothetical protein